MGSRLRGSGKLLDRSFNDHGPCESDEGECTTQLTARMRDIGLINTRQSCWTIWDMHGEDCAIY